MFFCIPLEYTDRFQFWFNSKMFNRYKRNFKIWSLKALMYRDLNVYISGYNSLQSFVGVNP